MSVFIKYKVRWRSHNQDADIMYFHFFICLFILDFDKLSGKYCESKTFIRTGKMNQGIEIST